MISLAFLLLLISSSESLSFSKFLLPALSLLFSSFPFFSLPLLRSLLLSPFSSLLFFYLSDLFLFLHLSSLILFEYISPLSFTYILLLVSSPIFSTSIFFSQYLFFLLIFLGEGDSGYSEEQQLPSSLSETFRCHPSGTPTNARTSGTYIIQYNTIQYNTIQYNTIQYNTVQYNTVQYNTTRLPYSLTVRAYHVHPPCFLFIS